MKPQLCTMSKMPTPQVRMWRQPTLNCLERLEWTEQRAQPDVQLLRGHLESPPISSTPHVAREGRPPSPAEALQTVSACTVHLQGMCTRGRAGG